MIAQISSKARQIVHHWNADTAQQLCRTDTRQLEQLRRVDGTATQQHLAPCQHHLRSAQFRPLDKAHAHRPRPVEHDRNGTRVRANAQIAPASRWPKVGA